MYVGVVPKCKSEKLNSHFILLHVLLEKFNPVVSNNFWHKIRDKKCSLKHEFIAGDRRTRPKEE